MEHFHVASPQAWASPSMRAVIQGQSAESGQREGIVHKAGERRGLLFPSLDSPPLVEAQPTQNQEERTETPFSMPVFGAMFLKVPKLIPQCYTAEVPLRLSQVPGTHDGQWHHLSLHESSPRKPYLQQPISLDCLNHHLY